MSKVEINLQAESTWLLWTADKLANAFVACCSQARREEMCKSAKQGKRQTANGWEWDRGDLKDAIVDLLPDKVLGEAEVPGAVVELAVARQGVGTLIESRRQVGAAAGWPSLLRSWERKMASLPMCKSLMYSTLVEEAATRVWSQEDQEMALDKRRKTKLVVERNVESAPQSELLYTLKPERGKLSGTYLMP